MSGSEYAPPAGSKLFPPRKGLKRDWQVGDIAIRATTSGVCHSFVLQTARSYGTRGLSSVECLDCCQTVNGHSPHELLTAEGYLAHCEHMRDDWTGKQYSEAVALAADGMPFTVPKWWAAAIQELREHYLSNEQVRRDSAAPGGTHGQH